MLKNFKRGSMLLKEETIMAGEETIMIHQLNILHFILIFPLKGSDIAENKYLTIASVKYL